MAAGEQYERFVHLVRLSWDLRGLGVRTSLILPPDGRPVLEIPRATGGRVRVFAVRRRCGWVFTWRPWWARLWRRNGWVVAHARNVADVILAEASL
ncbi:hypothetical protein GCM10010116_51460 [Microbispora rosea subsp. aerata]|nr:hypothetical protein [Microbispora rosea]GGO25646.1 hypothetical protein GCM10010116_51460 [Microbispora rosea subsp. aerata]GIH56890.1 hypothetical protein Mro02_38040 [Microbispora rosea subsp. aerata]GLJ82816.1 hypothetical protein GCM10017588_15420 [Microbispora rosea subsp. aerata]